MAQKVTMVPATTYASSYLASGKVPVKGFEIEVVDGRSVARNELLQKLNYDIMELPLSNYLIARDLGKPLTAIPVIPSLFFPQAGCMVNLQSGIQSVDDLIGKRVGANGFGYNPAAWLLGILFHDYDVPVERITWVEERVNSLSGIPFPRSRRFTIEQAEGLVHLLEEGEIQALIMPGAGTDPNATIGRLFPDYLAEVRRYLDATGIFPINTVITINDETLRSNPGLDKALTEAYAQAWRLYEKETPDDARHQGLPVGELRAMGLFPRPGFDTTRKAVRLFVHYCYEQALIRTLFDPADLFTL